MLSLLSTTLITEPVTYQITPKQGVIPLDTQFFFTEPHRCFTGATNFTGVTEIRGHFSHSPPS